ncbi:T6SS effector phospholipase Tle3 domain-containing protein [Pseudomonas syringae]|uniref:T6SS effector phospholipase Tle3 domain-containing protein n=1 Tax=Pseudomonas syringae TaxID=317 RepID=UPI003F756580
MNGADEYAVAQGNTRLIPNLNTTSKMEVPGDLPGVVIFLHGVNDPGASYSMVESGLCQGVNERLDRPDLVPGRYGVRYNEAKKAPYEERDSDQKAMLDDPDTYLYRRDASDPKTHSLLIPFYWGYRAAPDQIKRDDAGDPLRMRNQFQDINGNRLDRHFAKAGGFIGNATNNIPDVYSEEGFRPDLQTYALEKTHPDNFLYFGDAPSRHYCVFAAHRMAMLIREIRRVSPDETITIMAHSQGTIVTLLAQALLMDQGERCADTFIMVDTPYSVLPEVTPKNQDTLSTLISIVTAITQTPHAKPELSELRDAKTYGGKSGPQWSPVQGVRKSKVGNVTVFPERDNRGKVYLYFCPDDATVALAKVQGIGTFGMPDSLPDGRMAMMELQKRRFYQRMWTKRYRDGEPILVGKTPQPEILRAPGEPRYAGDSYVAGVAARAPFTIGQERLINGEALTPPHAPEMFGGEARRGTPSTSGLDRPDDVSKGVALGKDTAEFMWIRMPPEYDAPNVTQKQALEKFNALSDDPEKQTRAVRKIKSETATSSHHEREETPKEARDRIENEPSAWGANSYHSGLLRSPENHRWVTAMDIAIGQAKCLDDPAMRDVLVAIADWKIDEAQFSTISESPGWERLSEEAQDLVKASYLYYEEGEFPSTDLVSLTPPQPIQSAPKSRGAQ